jgi:hypothetical protein
VIGIGPTPTGVKLFGELSAKALGSRLDKELALWYELRAINVRGTGMIPHADAAYALEHSFGYSRSTCSRLLRSGNGKLWEINDFFSRIEIYSLRRVAEYFDLTHLSRPVEVKVGDFQGRNVKRARLYASFFKQEGSGKPISRDSIRVVTGVKRRQQQRYDKVAGLSKRANFAVRQEQDGSYRNISRLVDGKCRQWLKNRQLGNTYHSRMNKAHRGMIKRATQRSLITDEARLPRRFFLTPRSFIKCLEKHAESFLLVRQGNIIPGRSEWCLL